LSLETLQECWSACAVVHLGIFMWIYSVVFRVIALYFVKYLNFQLVSHVTEKVFDLVSWNHTGMLLSMYSCAPEVSLEDLFCFIRDIALHLNICNFQLVSHVAQKVVDFESWNITRMLISMCSCALGYFHVDIFSSF
jgi:hypothetical protein